jgi:hypothetical protein
MFPLQSLVGEQTLILILSWVLLFYAKQDFLAHSALKDELLLG